MERHGLVICPVVPYPPTGGAEKRTLRLLEAMEDAGARPHVLSQVERGAGGAAALRARGWGAEVIAERAPTLRDRARQHLARRPSPYLHGLAARLDALGGDPPAFVQVEHAMSAYYGARLPARPVVLSLHNVDSEMLRTVAAGARRYTPAWARAWNRALAMASVERRAVSRMDAVLCVSDEDAATLERLGARVVVVPNGVDDDLFDVPSALPPEDTVLFFGNLDYAPNAHGLARFLREGWPRLAAARPGARLRVAGPGGEAQLGRLLEGAERVEALGLVADLRPELARAALVVVPIWQGGGTRLKVLEALAAARPVAGTSLGVAGVGFRDGEHGSVADAPAELADAAAALLADRAWARGVAEAGRTLARRHRWAVVTEPARELYARWGAQPD